MTKVVVSIIAGSLLGVIGSRYLLFGSWLNLLPWGIAGLVIGYWSERREWVVNGGCTSFALAFVFLTKGYAGSAPLISRLLFFGMLGLFGGLCGLVLGRVGFEIKRRLKNPVG